MKKSSTKPSSAAPKPQRAHAAKNGVEPLTRTLLKTATRIPPVTDPAWKTAMEELKQQKKRSGVTRTAAIEVDLEVLSWFKAQDANYQTRINAALRLYMQAHTPSA